MIFYFTGTGNSLAAAKKLLVKGEQLINMAEARNAGEFTYTVPEHERVGFVYPEYCGSVGATVLEFVRNLKLIHPHYVYAVATCGGNHSQSAGCIKHALQQRGIPLHNAFYVQMPNNAVMFMPLHSPEKDEKMLQAVNPQILKIREEIVHHTVRPIVYGTMAKLMQKAYQLSAKTKKFFAEESCIGCGLCARNCPDHAIRMENGKPVWVKETCDICGACINRCPVQAIQYGKATKKRGRYVHPILR